MLDRESELDAMKRVNLTMIAAAHGYEKVAKRSTKRVTMMTNGSEKIAISENTNGHFVFWSVHDDARSGTAIDFAQKMIQPGCSLGEARAILRPFLNSGHVSQIREQYKERYTEVMQRAKPVDLAAVAKRYAKFTPIAEHHPYLCDVRGIPLEVLQSQRTIGRVRQDARGTVAFGHWGCPQNEATDKRVLTGYELKSATVSLFSSQSRKGLWVSAGMKGDKTLAVCESGIDALSYMAVHGEQGLRVASIAGNMNAQQKQLLRSAMERLGEGTIVAGFDNDKAGDKLVQQLSEIAREVSRNSLVFQEKRPAKRGSDWNVVLVEQQDLPSVQKQSRSLHFGR